MLKDVGHFFHHLHLENDIDLRIETIESGRIAVELVAQHQHQMSRLRVT